jgi:hypothetical protein
MKLDILDDLKVLYRNGTLYAKVAVLAVKALLYIGDAILDLSKSVREK